MPRIIGISGKKRSGKDELCNILLDMFPNRGERIAFADALKAEVAEVCGVSLANLEQHKAQFRLMLQWWGTEFRRQFSGNDNYWIERLAAAAEKSTAEFIIIPDVRFPNEMRFVRERDGIVIRIESNRAESSDAHASENALDSLEFDITLKNYSTLKDFHAAAKSLAPSLESFLQHGCPRGPLPPLSIKSMPSVSVHSA